jgi:hypothetical protein
MISRSLEFLLFLDTVNPFIRSEHRENQFVCETCLLIKRDMIRINIIISPKIRATDLVQHISFFRYAETINISNI